MPTANELQDNTHDRASKDPVIAHNIKLVNDWIEVKEMYKKAGEGTPLWKVLLMAVIFLAMMGLFLDTLFDVIDRLGIVRWLAGA